MTAIERLLGYFDDFGPVSTTYENAAALIRRAIELDATTPEPETSPAKHPSRNAQPGLRVGARVRVRYSCLFAGGCMGEIVAEGANRATYDWTVKLDNFMSPTEFKTDELEVIG